MTATAASPPLVAYCCPVCLARGKKNVLVRAAKGSVVEAFCRHCKFRKVVIV